MVRVVVDTPKLRNVIIVFMTKYEARPLEASTNMPKNTLSMR
jgi:hypothetical protein